MNLSFQTLKGTVKLRKYSDYEKVRPDLLQGGAQYVHVK
jgi:hypothetical protein